MWQHRAIGEIADRLPRGASLRVVGSALDDSLVDGWSDLNVHLRLNSPLELADLLGGVEVWAAEVRRAPEGQVVRAVLVDGRRVDLTVETGLLGTPALARDNEVRFLAALAVTKLGRGDRLIGSHLIFELLQACLVQAMLLRDREQGTTVHRFGDRRSHQLNQPCWSGVCRDQPTPATWSDPRQHSAVG